MGFKTILHKESKRLLQHNAQKLRKLLYKNDIQRFFNSDSLYIHVR